MIAQRLSRCQTNRLSPSVGGALDVSVPQLDLVVAAVDQPLHDLAAGAGPAQQLIRHSIVLLLVEQLEQGAAGEGGVADIESERDQRVVLVLVERNFDVAV